jgi:hypothetical protein
MEGEKMNRIGYSYILVPNGINGFLYKGEQILDLELTIDFKVIVDEKEIFFNEEISIVSFQNKDYYISNFINCFFEKDKLKIEKNLYAFQLFSLITGKIIKIEYLNFEYAKQLENKSEPINIEKQEFYDILYNNVKEFDNFDNKPCQVPCYSLAKVLEK